MAQNYSNITVRTRLKTRQLLLLAAMEEEGNVRRAAEILGMTQPAASRLLKELEDVLEVRLFDRTPHGMHPTLYGEVMIRHARMVLSNLSQAHDEIAALRAGLVGQVQIGAIAAAAATMVPLAIARVKASYPQLQIWLQVETSDVMLPLVAQGHLDIMVGRVLERQGQFKDAVRYEPIAEEPLCVVVRPGHPLASASGLTMADIVGEGWVLHPPGSVLRHRFDMVFSQIGLAAPDNVVNTNNIVAISGILLQSDMLAVMPEEVARQYEEFGTLKRLAIELPCRMDAFGIITRQTRLLSPAATVVLRALHDAALEVYGARVDAIA
ncbi:MAG: LysR family transcriptional regulator [Pseudomonadota bacterium]|uniref:Galactose-binding protein regulator n=1 Tax=Caballeronia sordidicola TaxID=196367 RepID=A0A242N2X0_CABSO|nr:MULTISPECIES: LysR family transcriptional regulator [Burkholderiaceae]AMH44008.1 LysR family transcriptional regulator [Burkholderia sp. PAMC 26561]MDP9152865.1 LysR family transcriptional regulator [Pseudomonadota bacterium]OTP77923.1 Galactose-binding protein regulator [Caballeronia sordidicola]